MERRGVRLVVALVAVLAVGVAVTLWQREQTVTAAEADVVGDPTALPPGTREVVPVSRREVVLCLKGAGFEVHSGTPREVVVVGGRGLPADTKVRVYGVGSVPISTGGWRASAQTLHTLGPDFKDVPVRRAFFNCVDPSLPPS